MTRRDMQQQQVTGTACRLDMTNIYATTTPQIQHILQLFYDTCIAIHTDIV